jgi:predicted Zn-dependent peptidase
MAVDRTRLPAVGPDPAFRIPAVAEAVLPNGLRVRTLEHPGIPIVTMVAQIEGGSGGDPLDSPGLTALTADLLDEGTGALSALDVADALARVGAEYDVEVGADATTLTLTMPAPSAGRGARLLADLIVRPALRAEDFERVRQLRLDRLSQLKDVPAAVAERAMLGLLYGSHPYGHLAIGTDTALRAVTLDDVVRVHARTFQPGRTTIIAAGALAHDALLALVEGAFGDWSAAGPGEPVGAAAAIEPPHASAVRLALVPRDHAQQSELRIGHVSVRRNTPDYPALLVMNAVLGGQFVSRINLKLREEKGYTYGARTGFDWKRGRSPFSFQASVHTAVTAEAIREAQAELQGIRGERPVSDEELTLAKASLTRSYPRNFETVEQVARAVAQLTLYGLPPGYLEEFVPRIHGVSGHDVARVASEHIDPARLTTLVVGDAAVVTESLGRLGLGDPVRLDGAS